MLTGISPGEIIIIGLVMVLALNRKDLGMVFRAIGKGKRQLSRFNEKLAGTVKEITAIGAPPPEPSLFEKKEHIRRRSIKWRKELSSPDRTRASEAIKQYLFESPDFIAANLVLIYLNIGAEVETRAMIAEMLQCGKKVALPYVRMYDDESDVGIPMGIGRISCIDTDTERNRQGFLQPKKEFWGNCFKSDIGLIVCPIIAFDHECNALFRSDSSWGGYLLEMQKRKPIWALAYSGQLSDTILVGNMSEFKFDTILTENGFVKELSGIARPAADNLLPAI
jgi:5,10-methenyltetrahydrofolate synthetase